MSNRKPTSGETAEFFARLNDVLDRAKKRLSRTQNPNYEMRVKTIRKHSVRAHTRNAFAVVYLAKINRARAT